MLQTVTANIVVVQGVSNRTPATNAIHVQSELRYGAKNSIQNQTSHDQAATNHCCAEMKSR